VVFGLGGKQGHLLARCWNSAPSGHSEQAGKRYYPHATTETTNAIMNATAVLISGVDVATELVVAINLRPTTRVSEQAKVMTPAA